MVKRELIDTVMASNLEKCHPALDFIKDRSIVTVREKALIKYLVRINGEEKFEYDHAEKHYCIVYNGKASAFWFDKNTLTGQKLFYAGKLDVIGNRWCEEDINKFLTDPTSPTFEEIYKIIANKFDYYYEFQENKFFWLLAVFTIYSYFYPLFSHAPILHFFGEFRTGKTKLCQIIECMTFNPLNSSNISAATIFRSIQGARSIIILDESEDITQGNKEKAEVVNMLLSGINKSGKAFRQEKGNQDNYQTQSYNVFSPKIIANIAGINLDSLSSRIIRIGTTSTTDITKKNRDVNIDSEEWQSIRNQLYRTCLTRYKEVIEVRDKLKIEGLSGRWFNIWQGLLVISKLCSSRLFERMLDLAIESSKQIEDEFNTDTPTNLLLDHLIFIKKERQKDVYSFTEIWHSMSEELKNYCGVETYKSLGQLMSRLGLKSKARRNEQGKVEKAYTLNDDWMEDRMTKT